MGTVHVSSPSPSGLSDSSRSPRRPSIRGLSLLCGLLLVVPLSACGVFDTGPSAKDAATTFLNLVAKGDTAAAARRTDSPKAARKLLDGTRKELSPKKVTTSVKDVVDNGDSPTKVRFHITWGLGEGRVWGYDSSMKLSETEKGWRVRWAPSVIHPALGADESLQLEVQEPKPAPILGRNGVQLMAPQELIRIIVVPNAVDDLDKVAESLAAGLQPVAPKVTKKSIVEGVKGSPQGQAHTVVTLRRADYEKVKPAIYELPGVWFPTETRLVTTQRGFADSVLSMVTKQLQDRINGDAGWKVFISNAAGEQVRTLHSVAAKPAGPIKTTLSNKIQRAAENAIDSRKKASMIVAIQPSSGDILAVAQNAAADKKGALALKGEYPPGSTFKIVTALAALKSGKVDINSKVPCPAKTTINGHTIPNAHNFDLGVVALRTAFAQSCNTTFAQLAAGLPTGALTAAANQLGLGVNFVVPGITTITGQVPPAEKPVQQAANGFGQGKVLATPFGMAMVTASVANGSMPSPTLIKGTETEAKGTAPKPPQDKAIEQLRAMMREVVKSGTATELQGMNVAGKTGTAQYGDGSRAHGWFVGYQGDMAFAVLLTDAGTSEKAVGVTKEFLSNAK